MNRTVGTLAVSRPASSRGARPEVGGTVPASDTVARAMLDCFVAGFFGEGGRT
jgi:hypothetical protein